MLFRKFIIEDDAIIIGKVKHHKQLTDNIYLVKGGGYFILDSSIKRIILGGKSHDFGYAEIEDLKKCIKEKKVFTNKYRTTNISDYYFYYDTGTEKIYLNYSVKDPFDRKPNLIN